MSTVLYYEELTSLRTTTLFVFLSCIFALLFTFSFLGDFHELIPLLWLVISFMFVFYVLNYYKLKIKITDKGVYLTFGIFTKELSLLEMHSCRFDTVPLLRIGGAGIHATKTQGKWRIMFNFLQYKRIVITKTTGFYKDIAFSTREPDKVILVLKYLLLKNNPLV